LVLVAGACGGGGDDDAKVKSTTSGNGSVSTTTTAPADKLERDVGKTAWWTGFKITIDSLTAEPQLGGGLNLTLESTFSNLGDQPATPPVPTLEQNGEVINLSSDAGEAAGQADVKGKLTAYLPDKSGSQTTDAAKVVDDLEVVWGEAGDNQSIIPLDESTEPTTFEPQEASSYAGKITTPTVVVDVSKGGYTWSYKSGDKGKFVLKAHIKITCGTPCPAPGTSMGLADFTLTAPGSSSPLSPDDEESEFCCEAVYPGTVSDDPTNTVAFVLDDEPSGKFTLTYTPETTPPKPGKLEFTI
jgi:hypothetical protein